MSHDPFIPRGTLKMVFAWVGLSVVVVAVAALMDERSVLPARPDNARQVASITFADGPDGGILIVSGDQTLALAPDGHGFIRGVLRALARERTIRDLPRNSPFVLSEASDGAFAIADPLSGTRIDLRAFGRDNTHAFAALMPTLVQSGEGMRSAALAENGHTQR
ncbi:MAG: photosynthetic complex assembly protein PuhC [Pseudomonadota bacterium]